MPPTNFLPYPNKKKELKQFLSNLDKEDPTQLWEMTKSWKSYDPYVFLDKKYRNKCIAFQTDSGRELTWHSLHRSNHQLNEACNKLWTTIEIVGNNRKLCPSFKLDFALGTLIPTLYYSQISALISMMTLFGVISRVEIEKSINFFNHVRTVDGWRYINRTRHISAMGGEPDRGWHKNVIQLYDTLFKSDVELPELNLEKTKSLQKKRNYHHYYILSESSMKEVYTKSLSEYYDFLPLVLATIKSSINTLKDVWGITNHCDKRFDELNKVANELLNAQEKTKAIKMPIKKEEECPYKEYSEILDFDVCPYCGSFHELD